MRGIVQLVVNLQSRPCIDFYYMPRDANFFSIYTQNSQ
jgi:hypothetical protein